jgi:hypothetical protein
MDRRRLWPNLLCAAGIVVSVLGGRLFFGSELRHGTISELCLLSGSALVALGAFFGKSRHRAFVYSAPGLALISLSAWIAYSIWLAAHHSYSVSWIMQYPLPLIYWLALWTSLTGAMLVLFASPRASMPAPGGVSVSERRWWSRTLSLVGFPMLAIGIVAIVGSLWVWRSEIAYPLVLLILPGSVLAALGALLGKSHYRTFLYGALWLTACVPITLVLVISPLYFEGFPRWPEIVVWTYPIGGLMSCVGAVLVIVETFRRAPVSQGSTGTA